MENLEYAKIIPPQACFGSGVQVNSKYPST